MSFNYSLLAFLLFVAMALSVALKKLTVPGALAGGLLGICVYAGAGITGLVLLAVFFVLGMAATAHKKGWKEEASISKRSEGRRTAGQVFANGGVAGLCGLAVLLVPQKAAMLQLMLAASLSSATADTVSSELGVVYGRNFYNIKTLQKDRRGLDGVVSREGTLAGVAGSVVVALVYAAGFGFSINSIWILVAGTIGNFFDSFLGATLERRKILNNNAVNFLNTFIAALVAFVCVMLS